jgi:hypothetical protein
MILSYRCIFFHVQLFHVKNSIEFFSLIVESTTEQIFSKVVHMKNYFSNSNSISLQIFFINYMYFKYKNYTFSAFSKYMILCDLFARRSGELPREERHDIIKYTKTR